MSTVRVTLAGILILLAPALIANRTAPFKTTATQELKRLQRPDGVQYASALYDDPVRWSYISKKIATGEPVWLQVANMLIPAADGAFAEELSSDLASALLVRPANVLRLLKKSESRKITPTDVCDAPFPSPGKHWLRVYKSRAVMSVSGVREATLREVRDDCLRALHSIDLSGPASAYQ
jgi:hypothetical protein